MKKLSLLITLGLLSACPADAGNDEDVEATDGTTTSGETNPDPSAPDPTAPDPTAPDPTEPDPSASDTDTDTDPAVDTDTDGDTDTDTDTDGMVEPPAFPCDCGRPEEPAECEELQDCGGVEIPHPDSFAKGFTPEQEAANLLVLECLFAALDAGTAVSVGIRRGDDSEQFSDSLVVGVFSDGTGETRGSYFYDLCEGSFAKLHRDGLREALTPCADGADSEEQANCLHDEAQRTPRIAECYPQEEFCKE